MGTPFPNPVIGGGGALVVPVVRSPNFDMAAKTGWAVFANGDAFFFNVTATGDVTATSVIVQGAGDAVFIYDGPAGPGTLVVAAAGAPGKDRYGNPFAGPGIAISAPGPGAGKNIIQIRPDKQAILFYAP